MCGNARLEEKAADKPELTVVIPNFNDGEAVECFIAQVISELHERPDYTFEILLVDDGSTDGSQARLRRLADTTPILRVIELFRNFGQQAALYVGLAQARGSIIVTIDGDGQYPPDSILALADAIRAGHDMASGIRQQRRDTIADRLASHIGGLLIRNLLKFNVGDFGSVKAFSRPLTDRILSAQIGTPDVYPAALSWKPLLMEIPIAHRPRQIGVSKWSLAKRLKLYFDLYFKYADDRLGLIFKLGTFLVFGSIATTCLALLYKLLFHHQESVLVILSLGAIFFVMGLQILLWSLSTSAMKQILRGGAIKQTDMIRGEYASGGNSDALREPNESAV
jgi:glycosyltransferase involved in cell wall biosynthesis